MHEQQIIQNTISAYTNAFIDYNIQNDKCFLILSFYRIIIIICDEKFVVGDQKNFVHFAFEVFKTSAYVI